jgi:hypothetical protein
MSSGSDSGSELDIPYYEWENKKNDLLYKKYNLTFKNNTPSTDENISIRIFMGYFIYDDDNEIHSFLNRLGNYFYMYFNNFITFDVLVKEYQKTENYMEEFVDKSKLSTEKCQRINDINHFMEVKKNIGYDSSLIDDFSIINGLSQNQIDDLINTMSKDEQNFWYDKFDEYMLFRWHQFAITMKICKKIYVLSNHFIESRKHLKTDENPFYGNDVMVSRLMSRVIIHM